MARKLWKAYLNWNAIMRDVVNNFVLNGRRAKGKGAVTLFPAIQAELATSR